MKKFIALLAAALLIVSMVGVVTAFAGCSIDGKSNVYAGSTYKYTGNASYTGYSLLGKISGFGQNATFDDDNGGTMDEVSISGSASISVKIPSDAAIGTTYTITLTGSYDSASGEHNFSDTKTITVVEKTSTPSTSTSHAAATPTPAPTGWALTAIDVAAMAQGGTYDFTVTDDPTVPAAVLASLKEKQGVLNVNLGSYTCTINGAALGTIPEGLAGIDLGLSMEKDEVLSASVGGGGRLPAAL